MIAHQQGRCGFGVNECRDTVFGRTLIRTTVGSRNEAGIVGCYLRTFFVDDRSEESTVGTRIIVGQQLGAEACTGSESGTRVVETVERVDVVRVVDVECSLVVSRSERFAYIVQHLFIIGRFVA